MRNNCNTMYFRLSAMLLSAVGLSVVSEGCVNDDPINNRVSSTENIAFQALQKDGSTLATRAGEQIPVNYDDFGDTSFYIYEHGTQKTDNSEFPRAQVGTYWLESGTQGQLDFKGPQEDKLNWFAGDTEHRFWSWTWPLAEPDYSTVDLSTPPSNEVLNFISSDFPLPASSTDTQEPDGTVQPTEAQAWCNGEALEQLVGTKTDRAYIFNQDGRYVPLTYKHLVSKIILGDFVLVDNTGASQSDLKARITFYGMPKRAMFFPLPEVDESGYPAAPYVTIDYTDPYGTDHQSNPTDLTAESAIKAKKEEATQDGKFYNLSEFLTFYITNEGGDNTNTGTNPDADPNVHRDMFYICPEVDFSYLEYKVEFVEYDKDTKSYKPHSKSGTRGGYFGDFKSVQFMREVEDGVEIVSSDRVLHAGEVMMLNMTVYQKSGPGAGVWIRNWDSEKLKSATHHTHKGIYSDGEASAVRSAFMSKTNELNDAQKAAYEIYGDTDDEGNKIIRLYSDITFSCYTSSTSSTYTDMYYNFRIYPETGDDMVILDGMGYTITFVEPSSYNHDEHKTFTIGNMRDIYITNGTSTIYIDPQGRICRINKETGKFDVSEDEDDLKWVNSTTKNTTPIKFDLDS